jgi:hypothetical protein
MLAGLFVLRQVALGALKGAGIDLWIWAKGKRSLGDRHRR